MRPIYRWPTFALALTVLSCLPVHAETLREAIEQAVRTNPEIIGLSDRRFAADAGVKQALAGYFPRLDVTVGSGRDRINSVDTRALGLVDTTLSRHESSLTLSQMLFDGFATRSGVAQQRSRVDSSAYNVAAAAENLGLRTVGGYLEVLRRQETVEAAAENLQAHQRIHDQIKKLSESGVGRRADFAQAESRLALAKANLTQEQSNLTDARTSYTRLVGTAPGTLVIPESLENVLPSPDALASENALSNHPALQAAKADVAAAVAVNAGAKAALWPRIDLELSSNRNEEIVHGVTHDRMLMLRLRYNFLRGGSDVARISETSLQAQEARETLSRTQREVSETLALSNNAYITARSRLDLLRQYVAASATTRESYAKQFSIGQRTLLDLLNAENEYFSARTSAITGRYALLASTFRIFAGMGQLLNILPIVLPADVVRLSEGRRTD